MDGELDTAALNTFCSGTDGFVTTWLDQSGNGSDAVNATASSQPKIYDSVSGIQLENGLPSVYFDGVDDTLKTDIIPDEAQPVSAFFVRRYRSVSETSVSLSTDSTASTGYVEIANNTVFRSFYGAYIASFPSNTNQGLWYSLANSTSSEIVLDDQSVIVANAGTQGLEVVNIGSAGTAFFAPVNIQEVIIYNSNQSSNRTGISANINDFYSIY